MQDDYEIVIMANGQVGWSHEVIVEMNKMRAEVGFARLDALGLREDGKFEHLCFCFGSDEAAEAFEFITASFLPDAQLVRKRRTAS